MNLTIEHCQWCQFSCAKSLKLTKFKSLSLSPFEMLPMEKASTIKKNVRLVYLKDFAQHNFTTIDVKFSLHPATHNINYIGRYSRGQ